MIRPSEYMTLTKEQLNDFGTLLEEEFKDQSIRENIHTSSSIEDAVTRILLYEGALYERYNDKKHEIEDVFVRNFRTISAKNRV